MIHVSSVRDERDRRVAIGVQSFARRALAGVLVPPPNSESVSETYLKILIIILARTSRRSTRPRVNVDDSRRGTSRGLYTLGRGTADRGGQSPRSDGSTKSRLTTPRSARAVRRPVSPVLSPALLLKWTEGPRSTALPLARCRRHSTDDPASPPPYMYLLTKVRSRSCNG